MFEIVCKSYCVSPLLDPAVQRPRDKKKLDLLIFSIGGQFCSHGSMNLALEGKTRVISCLSQSEL